MSTTLNIDAIISAAREGDVSPYVAATDRGAKAKIKEAVAKRIRDAVRARNMDEADALMSVEQLFEEAKSTVSRETKTPAEVIAERVATLEEAARQLIIGAVRPDGWEGEYPTAEEIGAVRDAWTDEVRTALVAAGAKVANQKITRTGQRRSVLDHVKEVLARQDDPTAPMKVSALAAATSSHYPKGDCSEGAIAARFWTADGYKGDVEGLHGYEASDMDGKGRGVGIA